jgi:hypothetical protein
MNPAHIVRAVITDLNWVADRWDDLVEYRLKGTPRPWRQAGDLSPEQRAARDALARLEIAEADRWGRAPGHSPAPLHVSTLDVMVSVLAEADTLHETVAQQLGHDRLEPAMSALDSPVRFLRWIAERVQEASEHEHDLLQELVDSARHMRTAVTAELGEIEDGQTLNAICPFCCGVTPRTPSGGARTLRFRLVESRLRPGEREALIVCENDCRPFDREVDTWHRGRPAWPWSQWEWLAERLLPAA